MIVDSSSFDLEVTTNPIGPLPMDERLPRCFRDLSSPISPLPIVGFSLLFTFQPDSRSRLLPKSKHPTAARGVEGTQYAPESFYRLRTHHAVARLGASHILRLLRQHSNQHRRAQSPCMGDSIPERDEFGQHVALACGPATPFPEHFSRGFFECLASAARVAPPRGLPGAGSSPAVTRAAVTGICAS